MLGLLSNAAGLLEDPPTAASYPPRALQPFAAAVGLGTLGGRPGRW